MLSSIYNVDLYTYSDTKNLPSIHAHPGANAIKEMPVIFHQSQINLNLTSHPIRNGVSLRVWDVLGCEGFLLTNYQNDLMQHFILGEHLDIYTSEEELRDKAAYYLAHPAITKEIAHNGYEYVKNHHTYKIRCDELIRTAFAH